jgi:hypothetical protein
VRGVNDTVAAMRALLRDDETDKLTGRLDQVVLVGWGNKILGYKETQSCCELKNYMYPVHGMN